MVVVVIVLVIVLAGKLGSWEAGKLGEAGGNE